MGSRWPTCITMQNFPEICCGDIEIFDFSKRRPPPSWIFKFLIFSGCLGSEGQDSSLSNFIKSNDFWDVILRFFQDGGYCHLGFWKFWNFFGWWVHTAEMHYCAKFHRNRLFHCGDRDYSVYQDGGCSHLGFLNFWNFIGWRSPEDRDASLCQISSKLVAWFWDITFFSIFQDGGHPSSWICLRRIWTTNKVYLVVFITGQNFVMIDAVVSVTWKFQYLAPLAGKRPKSTDFRGGILTP